MTQVHVALVVPPAREGPAGLVRSGIGDYALELAAALRAHTTVRVYSSAPVADEWPLESLSRRDAEHVWWQVGNEAAQAPLAQALQRVRGVVTVHDWILYDLACARWPELARGGWRGLWRAWREGGAEDARVYLEYLSAKQRAHAAPTVIADALVSGWHAPEALGRWSAREAWLHLAGEGDGVGELASVELQLYLPAGRALRVEVQEQETHFVQGTGQVQAVRCAVRVPCRVRLVCDSTRPDPEQVRCGDSRELGVHLRQVFVTTSRGAREVAWRTPGQPWPGPQLSAWRFALPLQRRVLAAADACFVHSAELRGRLQRLQPRLPVAVVEHGAAVAVPACTREEARALLGWETKGFYVVCFGGVQAHKRIAVVIEAVAHARRCGSDMQLVLAGAEDAELDLQALVTRHEAASWTVCTGRVAPERIEAVLRAADVCVQLRGPSTGGTSGGIQRALAARRAVIASDLAEQRELPDACVAKVAAGPEEVVQLATLLGRLQREPARVAAMERAADEYVRTRCAWQLVAQRSLQQLERWRSQR